VPSFSPVSSSPRRSRSAAVATPDLPQLGSLNPWAAALLTTWVSFVPCFLFIFLGAPYIERLRGNQPSPPH